MLASLSVTEMSREVRNGERKGRKKQKKTNRSRLGKWPPGVRG
jgi:hypothetical protein